MNYSQTNDADNHCCILISDSLDKLGGLSSHTSDPDDNNINSVILKNVI